MIVLRIPANIIVTIPCFGYLYNWYVTQGTDDASLTSSDDWSVTSADNFYNLVLYIDPSATQFSNEAGGELKEDGLIRWESPNSGATDNYGFSMIGSGYRNESTGMFTFLKYYGYLWNLDVSGEQAKITRGIYNSENLDTSYPPNYSSVASKNRGAGIRLVKDATGLADGVTTIYTGNDGKTYDAVVINELYYLKQNLEETLYRDLSTIPNITDNTMWSELTTGALCLYENNESYACKTPLPVPVIIYTACVDFQPYFEII